MQSVSKSIRIFTGAKDYNTTRSFYNLMGFEEMNFGPTMSYFRINDSYFYFQNTYVKAWTQLYDVFESVMLFLELDLKFLNVRITDIKNGVCGRKIFMHDPSRVLWHFGEFNNN